MLVAAGCGAVHASVAGFAFTQSVVCTHAVAAAYVALGFGAVALVAVFALESEETAAFSLDALPVAVAVLVALPGS